VCNRCRTKAAHAARRTNSTVDLLTPPPPLGPWAELAACIGVDPDSWYPAGTGHSPAPQVLRICRSCPVRVDCLTHALVTESQKERHGVWGGLSAHQRNVAWERLTDEQRAVYRPAAELAVAS
jgi:Transcription factor WhiB